MFMAVNVGTTQPAIDMDNVDDIKEVACLSQAVHGEAGNQSMEGKIAVAHVIVNRTKSNMFPSDDVCGVVRQKGQFDFLKRVRWIRENKPEERKQMEDSIKASLLVVGHKVADPTHGSLYFINPHMADQSWLRGLRRTTKIGDHAFYKPRT
jgi:N-acetylmuramoyl-L-alanine amidase